MDILLNNNTDKLITLQIGDIHMKGKTPQNRKDDYPTAIITKLEECFDLAISIKADCIFLLGDIFDYHKVSNETVSRLFHLFKKYDIPIYAIVGNHDEIGYNMKSYSDGSLGLLECFGALTVLQDNEKYFFIKNNIKLQVTTKSYDRGMEIDKYNYVAKKSSKCTHAIHLVHGYLAEKPLIFEHTLISSIWDKTEADVTYAGHYHLPFDVEHNGKRFINSGGVSRIKASLSEFRMPKITIQTIDENNNLNIEYYELKTAKPPEEVLDRTLIEIENRKAEKREMFFVKTGEIKNKMKNTKVDAYAILEKIAIETNTPKEVVDDSLLELSEARVVKEKRKGNINEKD